jgi:hypothetical protein
MAGLHETCQNEAIASTSIRGDAKKKKKKKKKRSFSSSSLAARDDCQEALVQ